MAPIRPTLVALLAWTLLLATCPADDDCRPETMLWAWERPEDLRFLDPTATGVAFLAATATLRGDDVVLQPRMQPLRVPPAAVLEAVVRVEIDRRDAPTLSDHQRDALSAAVVAQATGPGVVGGAFYADLLDQVRARLPAGQRLSITALASWCIGDPWIAGLPVDAAVPMLFEMGPDTDEIRRHLAGGGDFRPRICRDAVGLATNEPVPGLPRGRRTYLFHETAWNPEALADAMEETSP